MTATHTTIRLSTLRGASNRYFGSMSGLYYDSDDAISMAIKVPSQSKSCNKQSEHDQFKVLETCDDVHRGAVFPREQFLLVLQRGHWPNGLQVVTSGKCYIVRGTSLIDAKGCRWEGQNGYRSGQLRKVRA